MASRSVILPKVTFTNNGHSQITIFCDFTCDFKFSVFLACCWLSWVWGKGGERRLGGGEEEGKPATIPLNVAFLPELAKLGKLSH